MIPFDSLTRRTFLHTGLQIGSLALASLLRAEPVSTIPSNAALSHWPHVPPRAKRVIFLCQSGAPSQVDLFDYKPELERHAGEEIPASVRMGQRLTTMTSNQAELSLLPSPFRFAKHGKCGAWVSELMPHTAKVVDELCFIHAMHTEAINHDPAMTFLQTGSQQPGRPSIGAWLSYGLGSLNQNLPSFVVLTSGGGQPGDQPLYGRLWGNGFLSSQHAGVKFMSSGDPLLYLSNPSGMNTTSRRAMLDAIRDLNRENARQTGDAEIDARTEQYEMAFRIQKAAPDLVDLSRETPETFELYGEEAKTPGTFAANCLLARRLAERDVRFIQLYHRDWDHHSDLVEKLPLRCREVDRASAGLVIDLKRRGLLEDTVVIWGGEFGRTPFCQGKLNSTDFGRDHHPRCFTMWLAGGGVKPGFQYGITDDFSYNVLSGGVHVHDLHATLMHLLGIDHERFTFRAQGRDFRLTDIAGQVVKEVLV